MPFAPRLANTRARALGRLHDSTSRTGIEDDTTTLAPSGTAGNNERATPGSVRASSARRASSMAA